MLRVSYTHTVIEGAPALCSCLPLWKRCCIAKNNPSKQEYGRPPDPRIQNLERGTSHTNQKGKLLGLWVGPCESADIQIQYQYLIANQQNVAPKDIGQWARLHDMHTACTLAAVTNTCTS